MRIALGADETTPTVDAILGWLAAHHHEVAIVAEGREWPEVGSLVGEAVASGRADAGIVCCWTGTGVSIAANKVPGVRAALCTDAETTRGARRWNDANVLAVGLRLTSPAVAEEILEAFVATDPEEAERAAIERVEPQRSHPSDGGPTG